MPTLQTREQHLAHSVFLKVSAQVSNNNGKDDYGRMALKLPTMILTAGLAQALAFVEARGKDGHKALISDLGNVIGVSSLSERARTASLQEYMLLSRQALDALLWFKRYAQSMLDADITGEGE